MEIKRFYTVDFRGAVTRTEMRGYPEQRRMHCAHFNMRELEEPAPWTKAPMPEIVNFGPPTGWTLFFAGPSDLLGKRIKGRLILEVEDEG